MRSFRDPITNVLRAFGNVEANAPGDLYRDEPDDFNLEPGKWALIDGEWAPVTPDPRIAIATQIDTLERDSLLNRGSRELQLFLMEERAAQVAAARGIPATTVLAANIYYSKLKPLDLQIAALREQIK